MGGDAPVPDDGLATEALLGRSEIRPDENAIGRLVLGRRFLVTGAAGSIGSDLCRRLAACGAAGLVAFDNNESGLFGVAQELEGLHPTLALTPVLGDIRDAETLETTLGRESVTDVLHAAAYKHVPMMERQPEEAVRNNILGTRNVVRAVRKAGVDGFLMISSDKAVRPVSVMGATKRVAELIVARAATGDPGCRYGSVRLGNVLGSRGSVVPIFKRQIARGGPVTLTHRDARRVFLSLDEAASLILLAAGTVRGGSVCTLDTGSPVRIGDLAERMIRASGRDIGIRTIGLRAGERLVEVSPPGFDGLSRTPHDHVLMDERRLPDTGALDPFLDDLTARLDRRDEAGLVSRLWAFLRDSDSRELFS